MNILFVDDEANMPLLMKALLKHRIEKEGWAVSFASNGESALKTLNKEPKVDWLVTDLNMPNMGGFALLEHVKKTKRSHKMRTAVLSAYDDPYSRKRAVQLGVARFLTKPVHLASLVTLFES